MLRTFFNPFSLARIRVSVNPSFGWLMCGAVVMTMLAVAPLAFAQGAAVAPGQTPTGQAPAGQTPVRHAASGSAGSGAPGAVGPGADDAYQPYAEEPVIEISVASEQMPVLLVAVKSDENVGIAEQIANEIQLTGLFNVKTTASLKLGAGLPPRAKWPALTTAAVVIGQVPDAISFPKLVSDTYLAKESDVVRRRELTRYPGTDTITPSVMADAIVEDVLGSRAHMSGKLLFADGSTRGMRSVRVMAPNGSGGRRVSGFGDLARGADFDGQMRIWYASEDRVGKLLLFRENEPQPTPIVAPGYVQSVSFSPNGQHVVLSVGEGVRVRTWLGSSLDQGQFMPLDGKKSALSPSVDDQGRVVQTIGPIKGPFSVYVDQKRVSAPGVWAAMPSFCSTVVEERVVFMTRAGRSWNIRITSLTSGASRVIAHNGMAPTCSPDGKSVAFFSPGLYGEGPGIYLVADFGGRARKVWSGAQASGLRWRGGEKLPSKKVESTGQRR